MEDRASILREIKICRFCLTGDEPLKNIYDKEKNNAVPLPLQVMACVALEVFANDGMPQLICENCIVQVQQSYNFKTLCKRSDDALKLFLATGLLKRGDEEISVIASNNNNKRSQPKEKNESTSKRRRTNDRSEKDTSQKELTPKTQIVKVLTNDNSEIILKSSHSKDETSPEDNLQHIIEEIKIPIDETETIIEDESQQEMEIAIEEIPNSENYPHIKIIGGNEETQLLFEEAPPGEIVSSTPKVVKTHCFPCNHCDRSFPLQQLLEIHERNHTRERKFACKECDKRFFSKHDLNKHILTHSASKPFSCVVCDKSFSRITLLHRHEKIHVAVPKYLCTYCDRTFLTSENLDTHMKDHKKNRPYHCLKCDKKFAFKQGLERHELTHANENAFKCNYCSESFSTSTKLQRHVTSHAGNRPFPCKMCPRTFVLSHHLSRHMKSHYTAGKQEHSGDFKCDVCSMSFKKKYLLINHSAIHSMVNLKCVICNKEFEDAQTVKDHITTHLGGFPFECYQCEYSFETEVELLEHEQKHNSLEQLEAADDNVSAPRRSTREKRVKNFSDFLKHEELSEESDENVIETSSLNSEEDEDFIKENTFHPVVRNDSLKTYKGKEKQKSTELIPTLQKTNKNLKITTLENLGIPQSTLDSMNLDQSNFVEMKIGQKIIRVQKLMMTKAEVEAYTEQGKLDLKGCKVLVNNSQGIDLNKLTKIASQASLADESLVGGKNVKTYMKKVKKDGEQENIGDDGDNRQEGEVKRSNTDKK